MEDLLFNMDLDHPGVVPGGVPVVPNGLPTVDPGHHGFYDEFDYGNYTSGDCFTGSTFCTKSCDFFSEFTPSDKDNWLEETTDFSALSNSTSTTGSPVDNSWIQDQGIKSPMEILEEIRTEASQFDSDGASNSSFTEMTPLEVPSSVYGSPSPKELFPLQLLDNQDEQAHSEQPKLVEGPGNGQPKELSQEEINQLLLNQEPYLSGSQLSLFAESAPPPTQKLELVQVVGNEVVLSDGTRAVIIGESTTIAVPAGNPAVVHVPVESPGGAMRKKRVYQKGSYERKKMQNRESSFRYRIKKREAKDKQLQEYSLLSARNKELKEKSQDLEREITYWKKFIADLQK